MNNSGNQYIKFMSDIIESGLWGKLSPGARTLYPVLLKFSDQNFKQVWPSTETLLKLTGFKTKKSITAAKKELSKEGLLFCKSGTGRTNSTYFFSFNYKGSKITPLGDISAPLSGVSKDAAVSSYPPSQPATQTSPNNLNITITNNQSLKTNKNNIDFENLIDLYGFNIVESALEIAKVKGLENNIAYVAGICKNSLNPISKKPLKNNQEIDSAQHVIDSWRSFINWSKSHLTRSSTDILEKMSIEVDGQSIFIKEKISEFLKQIVLKYFNEEIHPQILIIFSETSVTSYSFERD